MSDAKNIRGVITGCGGMSTVWIEELLKNDGVEIVGLVDVREGQAEEKARECKLDNVVCSTNLDNVLKETQPDFVGDCSIPEAHYEITMTALRHGCHVFGEKPLADSMAHAREMVAAAEAAGKIYAVMQNRRYCMYIRKMVESLRRRELGRLTTLYADFFTAPHFGGFREEMDHVLLLDMAIHHFDAARLLVGGDPVSVYCTEWNPSGSWYKHGASTIATYEMDNGCVFNYRGSWCANGLSTSWECQWRAISEQGSICWDGGLNFTAETVDPAGNGETVKTFELPEADPHAKQGGHAGCLKEFMDCLREGRTPETTASDNIKSLSMVFGAIESARQGKKIMIESL